MDKLEQIGHLLVAALSKARELNRFALDSESRQKVRELVKAVEESSQKIDALNEATANRKSARLILVSWRFCQIRTRGVRPHACSVIHRSLTPPPPSHVCMATIQDVSTRSKLAKGRLLPAGISAKTEEQNSHVAKHGRRFGPYYL